MDVSSFDCEGHVRQDARWRIKSESIHESLSPGEYDIGTFLRVNTRHPLSLPEFRE